ncbi:hypothetical protein V496_08207, partial [Pseudogymnoascus sp. VKM F-4515 (FW-2607)]
YLLASTTTGLPLTALPCDSAISYRSETESWRQNACTETPATWLVWASAAAAAAAVSYFHRFTLILITAEITGPSLVSNPATDGKYNSIPKSQQKSTFLFNPSHTSRLRDWRSLLPPLPATESFPLLA